MQMAEFAMDFFYKVVFIPIRTPKMIEQTKLIYAMETFKVIVPLDKMQNMGYSDVQKAKLFQVPTV